MTIDVNKARLAAHRNNLMRYRRILATRLTDIERAYVRRRIDEERALLEQLEQQHRSVAASASSSRRAPAPREIGRRLAAIR
jgi:hypothetical protein